MDRSAETRSETAAPLSAPVFYILLALAGRERHGYAIIKEVLALTDAQVRMSTGTLYTALKRLLESGSIEESSARPDPALDDERRRYYRLTERGRQLAAAEAQRMAHLAAVAAERKLLT